MTYQIHELLGGHAGGVVGGMDPLHIQGRCPAVPHDAELADPRGGPAGDAGLGRRMAGGMVGEAPIRADLGVTARRGRPCPPQRAAVWAPGATARPGAAGPADPPAPWSRRQTGAAPPPAMDRLLAQMRGRAHRPRCQQGIGQFPQRGGPSGDAVVQVATDGLHGGQRGRTMHSPSVCPTAGFPATLPSCPSPWS